MSTVDLTLYLIQLIIDGAEAYKINSGSTTPLYARLHQQKMASDKHSLKIIYKPVNGEKYSLLIPDREFQILSVLKDGNWHDISSFKNSRSETRKPAAELRKLGLQIGTKRRPSQYKLFGEVELYPIGLGIDIKKLSDILPSLSDCNLIEEAKAKAKMAKRMAKIKQSVAFLEQEV